MGGGGGSACQQLERRLKIDFDVVKALCTLGTYNVSKID